MTTDSKTVKIKSMLTVKEFAEALGLGVGEVMTALMKNGVMATINDTIDFATAAIVGEELGFDLQEATDEATAAPDKAAAKPEPKDEAAAEPRPPIIAVMGHVDHGKTTLLDALRASDVVSGEAGGITQHLGAYQINYNDRRLTFIDTPGHEAFSALRAHGARLTDVAILVVAADDGVKPQTEEAIKFIRESGVRVVVAINKTDKPGADVEKTKKQLSDGGLNPEDWGGDTVTVEISAKEKQNLDKLLEMVLLVADIEDLQAPASGPASGTVVESHQVRGRGAVATLLVERGRLAAGDFVVAGGTYGRIRRLEDTNGEQIEQAGPATPAIISGLKELPSFGDQFEVVANEKEARRRAAEQTAAAKAQVSAKVTRSEELMAALAASKTKQLPLVVKADVIGSLQSLLDSLESISTEEVQAKVVGQGAGAINESDVSLAESANALILGFNVNLPVRVKQLAAQAGVPVKIYHVIYELLDDVREQLGELLEPETVETKLGKLEVKGVFRTTRTALICGGQVTSGKIKPGVIVRLVPKDGEAEEIGEVVSVQREQTEVKEVKEGQMCGLNIKTKNKIPLVEGDKLEFILRETKKRTL